MAYAADTRVPVSQSRAEIERLLEKHRAKQYGTAVDYDLAVARVQFRLHDRVIRFTIALPDAKKFVGERYARYERQRWRALLLVIKAKLESVESQIETFEQAFLANIVMPDDQTVGHHIVPQIVEAYKSGKMPKALGPGQP
jgi:hypothetical protein